MKKKTKKFAKGGETLNLDKLPSLNLNTGKNNSSSGGNMLLAAPATFRNVGNRNSSIASLIQNQNRVGGLGANNSSIASLIQNQNRVGGLKKGGAVKKKTVSKAKISSASKRADGCITKGKTKGKMV